MNLIPSKFESKYSVKTISLFRFGWRGRLAEFDWTAYHQSHIVGIRILEPDVSLAHSLKEIPNWTLKSLLCC